MLARAVSADPRAVAMRWPEPRARAIARLAMLVTEAQTQVVTDYVSDLVHSKSIEVDLQYYEDSQYYDLLQRAQQEAPYRPMSIIEDLMQVGQGLVTVGAMVALLLRQKRRTLLT